MTFANIFRPKARPADGTNGPLAGAGAAGWEMRLSLTQAPPSLNNAFVNVPGLGRVKSKAYRAWQKAAGAELMLVQRARPISGPVFVAFEIGEKASRADADNLIKALLDLLVWLQLIDGDSKRCVRGYAVRWVPGARDIRIAVTAA